MARNALERKEAPRPQSAVKKERNKSTGQSDDEYNDVKLQARIEKETNQWIYTIFTIILAISAIIVGVYIHATKVIGESYANKSKIFSDSGRHGDTLVIAADMKYGYMDHIIDRMRLFGHKISYLNSLDDLKDCERKELDQFDVIWSHDYPFSAKGEQIFNPRQRVNHFPGSGFITNKLSLSTSPVVTKKLKAFLLPQDEAEFRKAALQSDKLWVIKTNSHRGIQALPASTILASGHSGLVQEFMHKPMLIDGRKFDIGIYAALTSLEPIRVYIFDEALLRFCSHPYIDSVSGAFNNSDLDSYIVGDDYTPIWLMQSFLRPFVGLNLNMKRSLNLYLNQRGINPSKLWKQIENTIRQTYKLRDFAMSKLTQALQGESRINSTSVEGSLNQFFELVRFDFIVDEELNAYLMEANMSPNLSSRHFPPNRLLYEQVLNSFFSLVGLNQFAKQNLVNLPIRYIDGSYDWPKVESGESIEEWTRYGRRFGLDDLISDKDLSVDEDLCDSNECHMNCAYTKCHTCYFCLDYSNKLHIRRAIYEQMNRWNFKRLLPSTLEEHYEFQTKRNQQDDKSNRLHVDWFRAKCRSNPNFCNF